MLKNQISELMKLYECQVGQNRHVVDCASFSVAVPHQSFMVLCRLVKSYDRSFHTLAGAIYKSMPAWQYMQLGSRVQMTQIRSSSDVSNATDVMNWL